ncbi:MAG TPA: carbohydrate ABC transporter permease, partial [Microlunatus sp.]|nr:carbohydrate ABC transporter permease [Microlunatus sp.]
MSTAAQPRSTATSTRSAHRVRRRRPHVEPFTVVSLIGVSLFALICIIPLWMILAGSFTDESRLAVTGYSMWPKPFSLDAYTQIFSGTALAKAYGASGFITIVGTLLSTTFSAGLAWVIARRMPIISRTLMIYAYIPLLFTAGLVPLYLLVTQYLHLQNSWWAVILPHMMAPFLIFIAVSFFQQLPAEILESARMDGAGELRTFFTIVLPLSKPILAVIALFYAVTY